VTPISHVLNRPAITIPTVEQTFAILVSALHAQMKTHATVLEYIATITPLVTIRKLALPKTNFQSAQKQATV
jgi:hypothetical protein